MLTILLKLTSGFLIGKMVGRYCANNELSPILGIALTVACVLAACLLIDKGLGNV
jgi:hypothetical protein